MEVSHYITTVNMFVYTLAFVLLCGAALTTANEEIVKKCAEKFNVPEEKLDSPRKLDCEEDNAFIDCCLVELGIFKPDEGQWDSGKVHEYCTEKKVPFMFEKSVMRCCENQNAADSAEAAKIMCTCAKGKK